MKLNIKALKNKFKQGNVILFLVSEVLINLLLFYPLVFAVSLAEASVGFSIFKLIIYLPFISSASGLLVLLMTKPRWIKLFSGLFFLSKILLLIYIFLKLFQSWYGWLLLFFILVSFGIIVRFLKKKVH
ncbi:hypothetical protein [Enterococcus sp. CWB-B31]|uniref:hypothetical protein n=1 Tax=Enterococcus sp. CWB-B31 TaxID=2885159 RepID=UPI001E4A86D2|nr:hypothetical protein [Enterococcus sp. CWB-B31]MCB5955700.1 hypothetical protein [Enterococcus sp. CWB-B31]